MKKTTPTEIPPGQRIIQAIISSAALEGAVNVNGRTVYIWREDSPERIEAALGMAGFKLTPLEDEESARMSA